LQQIGPQSVRAIAASSRSLSVAGAGGRVRRSHDHRRNYYQTSSKSNTITLAHTVSLPYALSYFHTFTNANTFAHSDTYSGTCAGQPFHLRHSRV
jgi:hypothetical protein